MVDQASATRSERQPITSFWRPLNSKMACCSNFAPSARAWSRASPITTNPSSDQPVTESVPRFEPIALSSESTVVAEFEADPAEATRYQSEAELEAELIRLLGEQAYEYLPITSEADLVANLRTQLEALNRITFTDAEWTRFFAEKISGEKDGIVEKTIRIQEDHVQLLKRDDGSSKNITLLDKTRIHNNRLQVINQYEVPGAPASGTDGRPQRANRYDVTILVNGLPLVHVELKRRGVDIREAFNQINRYQRDSFWAGSGLFEYVQLASTLSIGNLGGVI